MKTLAILIIAVLMTGCVRADFPRKLLPQVESLPPSPTINKSTLTYTFSAQYEDLFESKQLSGYDKTYEEHIFTNVLEKSGYFTTISEGVDGDVAINANIIDSYKPFGSICVTFSQMTLSIFPGWVTEDWTIIANVKTMKGSEKHYVINDSNYAVSWWPIQLFVMPIVHKSIYGTKEVQENMWKTLLQNMHRDGLF